MAGSACSLHCLPIVACRLYALTEVVVTVDVDSLHRTHAISSIDFCSDERTCFYALSLDSACPRRALSQSRVSLPHKHLPFSLDQWLAAMFLHRAAIRAGRRARTALGRKERSGHPPYQLLVTGNGGL